MRKLGRSLYFVFEIGRLERAQITTLFVVGIECELNELMSAYY